MLNPYSKFAEEGRARRTQIHCESREDGFDSKARSMGESSYLFFGLKVEVILKYLRSLALSDDNRFVLFRGLLDNHMKCLSLLLPT